MATRLIEADFYRVEWLDRDGKQRTLHFALPAGDMVEDPPHGILMSVLDSISGAFGWVTGRGDCYITGIADAGTGVMLMSLEREHEVASTNLDEVRHVRDEVRGTCQCCGAWKVRLKADEFLLCLECKHLYDEVKAGKMKPSTRQPDG